MATKFWSVPLVRISKPQNALNLDMRGLTRGRGRTQDVFPLLPQKYSSVHLFLPEDVLSAYPPGALRLG